MEQRPKRLLDQVCDAIRRKHYSMRTEKACEAWLSAARWMSLLAPPNKKRLPGPGHDLP